MKSRYDYLPFGEELVAGIGGRTTAQGYGQVDGNRKKWATYERDDETGLDYAQARYYSNTQGRFTSADPTLLSLRATNPQTSNRYAYVLNNPLRYADPSGLWELDYSILRKRNGEVDKVIINIKRSKEGDSAATLAKQLGYDPSSKEGKKLIEKIDKAVAGGDSVQGSKLGGIVGRAFGAAEHGLTAQAKFAERNPQDAASRGPSDSQYNDCSMTTCRIALPGQMMGSEGAGVFANFGVRQADEIIGRLGSVSSDALRTGDIVRYADEQNTPTHFMNVIFTGDDGTTKAFSRSGVNGRFEIVPVDAFNGTNYGRIKGKSGKDTGFYRP